MLSPKCKLELQSHLHKKIFLYSSDGSESDCYSYQTAYAEEELLFKKVFPSDSPAKLFFF